MAIKQLRVLSRHPSYKEAVPCILISGKELANKYNWKVGDQVKVDLEENGVKITKVGESLKEDVLVEGAAMVMEETEEQDEIQEETTSMEEKLEKLKK